eukprot:5993183-Alexandrium_andersonii.AAC.1
MGATSRSLGSKRISAWPRPGWGRISCARSRAGWEVGGQTSRRPGPLIGRSAGRRAVACTRQAPGTRSS